MSFAHPTNILKSLLADWDAKAADKACLSHKLHICFCSPTGKVVLRMATGLIAKLKLRTRYKTPAMRYFTLEDKLALRLRGELLVQTLRLRVGGELFGKVNFLWHVSWMCLSPYLPHVHVLHAADIEVDLDNDRQHTHARLLAISWYCIAKSLCWIQH